jgi:hypothetical protein
MDFRRVVGSILTALGQENVRYAAIGGFALGAIGIPRATADLDLLVHHADLERLDEALQQLGYTRRVHLEDVSQYTHPDTELGTLDLVHARRKYALAMLQRATLYPIFDGSRTVRAVQPEDLVGLKVQAMVNDPARQAQETADIETLASLYGTRWDWGAIQEYFDLFELGDRARALRQQHGPPS